MSKAQAIRDYKDAHPNATPKTIAEALCNEGVEVTPNQVSTTLSTDRAKAKAGKSKTTKPAKVKRAQVAPASAQVETTPEPVAVKVDALALFTAADALIAACGTVCDPVAFLTAYRRSDAAGNLLA